MVVLFIAQVACFIYS